MADTASIRQLQSLRDAYLESLYRKCNGKFSDGVNRKKFEEELGISEEEATLVFEYLLRTNLIRIPLFQNVTLSNSGIEKVEGRMTQSYEEKEYLVLKTLLEDTKNDDVVAADLAKLIPIPESDIYYILKDFDRKGWTVEHFEDTARITDLGVTAFHKWEQINSPVVRDVYNTNIHGNSINQIGGQGNKLEAQITNNPDFDNAIGTVIELLNQSSLSDDDKQEALNDIQAINKLAVQTPANAFERAKLRITAVETIVKGTELATKLVPHFQILIDYFRSLSG